jgi:oxaloacetate decarboxylase gamma subunit
MTIVDMLGQSGVLTLLGMGIVFSFLVIMIIVVTLAGKAIHALRWDSDVLKPAKTQTSAAAAASVSGGGNQGAVTAAISAAVAEYRKDHS